MKTTTYVTSIGLLLMSQLAGCMDMEADEGADADAGSLVAGQKQERAGGVEKAQDADTSAGDELDTDSTGADLVDTIDTGGDFVDTDTDMDSIEDEELDLDAGVQDGGELDLGIEDEESTVLIIFDKSGSMGGPWDERSKWQAASDALVSVLSDAQDRLTVGGILFPMVSGCEVAELSSGEQMDFMPGGQFLSAWEASMEMNAPGGSTPLEQAFHVADRAIDRARRDGLLELRFQVILLTDGEPNCDSDPELLTGLPAKWLSEDIKTYVFGLPGSSPAEELLGSIAKAGGTDAQIAPGDPEKLRAGLAAVI